MLIPTNDNIYLHCTIGQTELTKKYISEIANVVIDALNTNNKNKIVYTNADYIRSMSNEKLCTFILTGCVDRACPEQFGEFITDEDCKQCWLNWFKTPIDIELLELYTNIINFNKNNDLEQ